MKGKGFKFHTGDVNWLDYGGVWCRHIDGQRFHFIELTNMDEACGRDNEGHPTYSVTLSEVDGDVLDAEQIYAALESCGDNVIDSRAQGGHMVLPPFDATVANIVRSYGIASPLHEESTNNAHKGIAVCRAESYRLTRDDRAYQQAMNRPVNRIGSTAREFGRGDLTSGLVRSARAGDPNAQIIAKMYVNTGGQTLGGRLPEDELAAIKGSIA